MWRFCVYNEFYHISQTSTTSTSLATKIARALEQKQVYLPSLFIVCVMLLLYRKMMIMSMMMMPVMAAVTNVEIQMVCNCNFDSYAYVSRPPI